MFISFIRVWAYDRDGLKPHLQVPNGLSFFARPMAIFFAKDFQTIHIDKGNIRLKISNIIDYVGEIV